MNNNEIRIKKEILSQTKPFCLTDIKNRLHDLGIYDDHAILSMIDNLFDSNLIYYDKVLPENMGNNGYAFITKNMINNDVIKKNR